MRFPPDTGFPHGRVSRRFAVWYMVGEHNDIRGRANGAEAEKTVASTGYLAGDACSPRGGIPGARPDQPVPLRRRHLRRAPRAAGGDRLDLRARSGGFVAGDLRT